MDNTNHPQHLEPDRNLGDKDFPRLYRAHHADYKMDIPFWLALADQYGGPVLELGCGTGRVMLQIASQGIQVVGLDDDQSMINELENQISMEMGTQVTTHIADMAEFDLDSQFPLVILPCNTYSTLTASQRKSTLENIHDHLGDGGIFALSSPNIDIFRRMPDLSEPELETSFSHPDTGNPVQVSSGWKKVDDIFQITWIYDHLKPDGLVERLSIHAEHDLQPIHNYREEILDAGFLIQGEYGDFNLTAFSQTSYYWIMVAMKAPSLNSTQ